MPSENQEVEKLLQLLQRITETPIDDLIYNKDWGIINFSSAKLHFERIYEICHHFQELPIDKMPSSVIDEISEKANNILEVIQKIKDFKIEDASHPTQIRNEYIDDIKRVSDAFYMTSHIYVPFLAYQNGEVQDNIKEIKKIISDLNALLQKVKNDTDKQAREIDKTVKATKDAAASVGVAHFSDDFKAEADDASKSSKYWLIATICLYSLLFVFAIYCFFFDTMVFTDTANIIQHVSSKVLIILILLVGAVWCGDQYKTLKHQQTENKFRYNGLRTFQAFVAATEDSNVRDAVLMETTKSIFRNNSTGYIKSDNYNNSDSGVKIVEVVKNSTQTIASATKN
jgi:hypothetical protein